MHIYECHTREDLDRYVQEKLIRNSLQPTQKNKLSFLYGAREALNTGSFKWHENYYEMKNLINAEICRLRVEQHVDPMLF